MKQCSSAPSTEMLEPTGFQTILMYFVGFYATSSQDKRYMTVYSMFVGPGICTIIHASIKVFESWSTNLNAGGRRWMALGCLSSQVRFGPGR